MSYRLEHTVMEQLELVGTSLQETVRSSQPDLFIISEEGHKIVTHKVLLILYSPSLSSALGSLPPDQMVGLTVPGPSASVSHLLKLLSLGVVVASTRHELEQVSDIAESLGINLGNWQIGVKNPKKAKQQPEKRVNVSRVGNGEQNRSLDSGNRVPCNYCDKDFSRKDKLNAHMRSKHPSELDEPTNNTSNEVSLGLDNEIEQENLEKLPCPDCGKIFGARTHLNRHRLLHSGVRFQCEVCDKTFSRKDKLNAHMRNKHSGAMDDQSIKQEVNSALFGSEEPNESFQEDASSFLGAVEQDVSLQEEDQSADFSENMTSEDSSDAPKDLQENSADKKVETKVLAIVCPYCNEYAENIVEHSMSKHGTVFSI